MVTNWVSQERKRRAWFGLVVIDDSYSHERVTTDERGFIYNVLIRIREREEERERENEKW